MMRRSVSIGLLALVSATAGACVPRTRTGATVATVGGAAVAVAGSALLISLQRDDFESEVSCAVGGCAVAGSAILAGLGIAIAGLVGLSDTGESPAAAPASPLPGGQGAITADEARAIDIRVVAPLPEAACDAETLRLAKQARGAARRGDCATARRVTDHIAGRDQTYAEALVTSPALATCRQAP